MIVIDGIWSMEGLDRSDTKRIKNHEELTQYINKIGFLPLFKGKITGFSVEEITGKDSWWNGNPLEDPWAWREVMSAEGKVCYGKLYSGKAGFVSKEWYPVFASYRRDGYDFDSRYEEGLASNKSKRIMDLFSQYEQLPSYEIKSMAGFGKNGEKGFEGAISTLQMQTYLTVRGFQKRHNKKNEVYGWSVAQYSLAETIIGEDFLRSAYDTPAKEAKEKIIKHLMSKLPHASYDQVAAFIK